MPRAGPSKGPLGVECVHCVRRGRQFDERASERASQSVGVSFSSTCSLEAAARRSKVRQLAGRLARRLAGRICIQVRARRSVEGLRRGRATRARSSARPPDGRRKALGGVGALSRSLALFAASLSRALSHSWCACDRRHKGGGRPSGQYCAGGRTCPPWCVCACARARKRRPSTKWTPGGPSAAARPPAKSRWEPAARQFSSHAGRKLGRAIGARWACL